jgi:hypothetical protein
MQLIAWAFAFAFESAGNSIPASIAIIAMTTSNSISVKPDVAERSRTESLEEMVLILQISSLYCLQILKANYVPNKFVSSMVVVCLFENLCTNRRLADRSGLLSSSCSTIHPNINAHAPEISQHCRAKTPKLHSGEIPGQATKSPWAEMRVASADEQFEGKSLEPRADLRFPRRLCNILSCLSPRPRPPCALLVSSLNVGS